MTHNFLLRMKKTKNKTEYLMLLAMHLYLVQNMKAHDVAAAVNSTKGMVYQWAHIYKNVGITGFINKPKGGRTWSYLTLQQEKDILSEPMHSDEETCGLIASKIIKKK